MMSLIPFGRNNPNLDGELQTLTDKMELLGSRADDIQCQLRNEELQPSKKRKSEVTLWLKRVEEIKQDFESIKAEILVVENIDRRKSRALLNEMKGMMEDINQLLMQGEFSQGIVLDDLKPEGIDLVTTKLEGSTPLMVKDEVWSAFKRGESRVGIFGMGGVGKTAVAMHLNNEIVSGCRDCFNHVFYVTVSRGSTVHKLQHDVSTALTLTLSNEDEARRASELCKSLKRREKSLLILDDIWEDIRMDRVGVAVDGDGCKLLITTRKRDVCRKMNCSTVVEMKPLRENEAWKLFVGTLGNYESLNDATKCVARSIAKECAGLPLAIITMASCMRSECDEREWRYMLRQLRNPSSNQDDMDEKVFAILKLSYERLSNDMLRQCLLYCALCVTEYEQLLIIDLIAEALLKNRGTRKENIDEGHHMLKALADASLLECRTVFGGRIFVKMHDLIRDMAVKIIGSEGIVKPGKGMKEMPRKEEWTRDSVLVSLMSNSIQDVGDELSPECPNLSVLLLRRNPIRNIPSSFFVHMEGLRYLDLCRTKIKELPDSVANLCNLNTLLLNDCKYLEFIPSVGKLTKLMVLNLSCAGIKELPEGFEKLINLELLNILKTKIQSLPEGLLCKLCKLKSFFSGSPLNIVPKELMSLRQLVNFEGYIDDFDAFKQFVCSDWFDQLQQYSIHVGDFTKSKFSPEQDGHYMRRILICGRQLSIKVPYSVMSLKLEDCSFGVDGLLEALPSLSDATELELCDLKRCPGIKYIVSDAMFERGEHQASTPVKGVHRLTLHSLYDFVGLYEGNAVHPHSFFGGLRELSFHYCPRVNKIWLQKDILPNLESIEVLCCPNMEEVFATTEGAAIELPCLKSINVKRLSELKSICRNNVFLPCLEMVNVFECPKLEKLWSVKDELPNLQAVSVEVCGNASFIPQLQKVRVQKCPKLKKLLLLNHSMPSLRLICIEECIEMEEIFEMRDGAGDDAIQLPNLQFIVLRDLPELRSICRKAIVCNSLERVILRGDNKLENCPISMPMLLLANNNPPFPLLWADNKSEYWLLTDLGVRCSEATIPKKV